MKRNPDVLVQIARIDQMAERTGIRAFCQGCIHKQHTEGSYPGGCCTGCTNLGPNGCTEKPLSCALWLCRGARKAFPQQARGLDAIARIWPSGLAYGFRMDSLQQEARL